MMKDKVRALWELCFNDSEAFVDIYFGMRYNDEVNVAIQSGKQVIAALQMIPYPMTFCGKLIQTAYISGACTHPDYRGHGVMRELLSQAFAQMSHNSIQLSTLIPAEPWLFDYYSQLGYSPIFRYSIEQIQASSLPVIKHVSVRKVDHCNEAIYQYLNYKIMERPCCIQHTPDDFKMILADAAVSNGTLYVATVENRVVGIAIVYVREDGLFIDELFADNEEIKYGMLNQIKNDNINITKFQCIIPPMSGTNQPVLGMGRIIDARNILELYAAHFPEKEMSFTLTDQQRIANTGYYQLSNGKCKYSNEAPSKLHLNLTIAQLGEMILSPLQPYMSLMLN